MYVLIGPAGGSYGAGPLDRSEALGSARHQEAIRITLSRTPGDFLNLRHKLSRRLLLKGSHFFFARNGRTRVLNFARYLMERRRASKVCYLPPLVFLDTSVACNLRCPGCATGLRVVRPAPRASLEFMKSVIDQVSATAVEISFFHWGEPFLNDQVFEAISYARSRGVWTVASSHLSLKLSDLPRRIAASGLHELLVSCDGATQETYVKYRKGGDLELVWSNLREIRAHRERLRQRTPILRAKMIVFEHNWHEAKQFRDLALENGADEVEFAFGNGEDFFRKQVMGGGSRFDIVDLSWKEKAPEGICDEIWQALYVTPDGGAQSCCMGHKEEHLFALPEGRPDIRQVWNNESFVASRNYFLGRAAAGQTPSACRNCLYVTNFSGQPRG